MSRCGGCQIRHQLRLSQLVGGLHPSHWPHGPQHQQRHRLHLLHPGEPPPGPQADPGAGGGPTGHQSQTAAAGGYWTGRRWPSSFSQWLHFKQSQPDVPGPV